MITGAEQLALPAVPDGEGKIADKIIDARFAPALVRVQDQLGIGSGEDVSRHCQLADQPSSIVYARVRRDPNLAV